MARRGRTSAMHSWRTPSPDSAGVCRQEKSCMTSPCKSQTRTTSGTAVDSRCPQWNIDARSIVFQRTTLTGSALHLLHLYGDLAGQTDMLRALQRGGQDRRLCERGLSRKPDLGHAYRWFEPPAIDVRADGSMLSRLVAEQRRDRFRARRAAGGDADRCPVEAVAASPRRRFASAAAGRTLERPVRVNGSSVT